MKVRIKFEGWVIEVDDQATQEEITKQVIDTLMFKGIKKHLNITVKVINKDEIGRNDYEETSES